MTPEELRWMKKRANAPEVATGAFILNDKNEALLITGPKFRPIWTVPGGHVHKFETIEHCARRELKEETGLKPKKFVWFKTNEELHAVLFGKRRHFIFLDFAARVKGRPTLKLNEEISAWAWLTESQIRRSKGIRTSAKDAYVHLFQLLRARKIKI